MKAPTTQSVAWKVFLMYLWLEIISVDSRPFIFPDSRPMLPGPYALESKTTIADVSKMYEMTKNWVDPDTENLNQTALLLQLGKDFDSFYMSVDPPKISQRFNAMGLSMRSASIRRQDAAMSMMPWPLRQLQFEIKRGGKKRGRVLGHRASSKLRQWLWELSRCPINYSWVDYGAKFFPRYIRYGKCIEKPCSFPNGMTCKPKSTRTLRLLIWVCTSSISCSWRSVSLQMYESCQCSCQGG